MNPSLRWFSCLLVLGLLAGCASIAPNQAAREQLQLERSDEVMVQTRAGRFILRGQTPALEERGAQGRFEWLDYRSARGTARQVLIWLGPLGQSAASLELGPLASNNGSVSIAAYDENGLRLGHQDQLRFLSNVLGNDAFAMSDAEIQSALQSIMRFFQTAVGTQTPRHESQFRIGAAIVHLRIAFDQP